ncbi:MAG: PQQ-binding-like beta-propeller repeat protein [Anaerolineae bacterium]|nr:PQQ-binding-like beta-propeller repeat protein [Anaerolineae bacterium]
MSNHPSDEQLIGYIHQTLTDAEREEIDQHLAECAQCRALLTDYESLQRRIYYGLANDLRKVSASSRKSFAAIAPRLKRGRRWAAVRITTERLSVVTALAAIFLVVYGLITQTLPINRTPIEEPGPPVAMFRGNLWRTGAYDAGIVPGLGQKVWAFTAKHSIWASPTFADGMVYLTDQDGNIYALDGRTGQKKWGVPVGIMTYSSPIVDDDAGVLYVIAGNQIYALDSQTGEKQGKHPSYWTESSPTIVDGVLYVGTNIGYFYALDIHTGQEMWKYTSYDSVVSSPAVVDGTVYFGSGDQHFYALDAQTGQEVWKVETGGRVDSSPAIYGDAVYFGSYDGCFRALDRKTGREIWCFPTEKGSSSSPAVVGEMIYFGDMSGHFYALDRETGREVWKVKVKGAGQSSPAVANGVVYLGSSEGYLYALDARTGAELWKFAAKAGIKSSPIVADGMVYFGSEDGTFYAVK